MKADEIRRLPGGTTVYGLFGQGIIVHSPCHGKGVRFDAYDYTGPDDMHGFDDRTDEDIDDLKLWYEPQVAGPIIESTPIYGCPVSPPDGGPKDQAQFSAWAVVELLGHQRFAGHVSIQRYGWIELLRLDVPATKTQPAICKLVSHHAIFSITVVTEQTARIAAETWNNRPFQCWDILEVARKQEDALTSAVSQAAKESHDCEGEEPGEDDEGS